MPTDLDKSGSPYQRAMVGLGPTLGKFEVSVQPYVQQTITVAGTTTLGNDANLVFVNCNGLVTVQLPNVVSWLTAALQLNVNVFNGAIWVKDIGGFAAAQNITVKRFGTQKIDNLSQDFTILQARQLIRLYPMYDLSGWFVG